MRRNVVIAIAAGALAIVLVWYFALYSPKSKDVSSTQDQVTEAKRQTQSLQATFARLTALDKERPQQQATLDKLNAAIPSTPDLANFIFQANEIAAQSGVDWLSVAPTPPAASTTGGPSVIALNIQVQGGFFQVLDYLNRLEQLARLVVTDSVNISSGSGSSGGGGATTATTLPTSTSSTGAPTLSVTLGARMFTRAVAVPGTPGGATAGGATPSAPTTPTTTPSTATTGRGAGNS